MTALDNLRVVIASATEDLTDELFCAEIYLSDQYVGRICEISGTDRLTLQLEEVVGNDADAFISAMILAKERLIEHKRGNSTTA